MRWIILYTDPLRIFNYMINRRKQSFNLIISHLAAIYDMRSFLTEVVMDDLFALCWLAMGHANIKSWLHLDLRSWIIASSSQRS